MVAFVPTLAACWLLGRAGAAAHERFVAVETGAILSPRQYQAYPAQPLRKRQDVCSAGWHPCNDIGPPGANNCCPNDQYCIIDPNNKSRGACCYIGSRCRSMCDESSYQCNITTTVTISGTTTTSLSETCCQRSCPSTSMFQCASSLGNGCCGYGSRCGENRLCYFTPRPTTSAGPTLPPPGCTTGQTSCASSLGGGCCAATQSCTLIDDKAHCAETPVATPTGSGVSVVNVGSGLSPGATAGVVIGVVVGCGLSIGAVIWWWRRRRRRARRSVAGSSSIRPRPAGVVGRILGGGGQGGGSAAGGGGREMSDENSDMMSRSGRLGGLAQDYFGPDAAMGPYSETHTTSAVTTPGVDRGGVPLQPHEPGDIAVPVEIDSRLREARRAAPPPGLTIAPGANSPHDNSEDNGQERYELYGSDVGQISPSLPSPHGGGMPSLPDERPRLG